MKTLLLALIDAISLLMFTIVGLHFHRAMTIQTLLRDLGPLLGAWIVFAPVTQIYRRPRWWSLPLNWALAIPAGILVRQALLGRALDRGTLIFLVMALIFTLLFLVAGRLVVKVVQADTVWTVRTKAR